MAARPSESSSPRVVIVGGGFGGLYAAEALKSTPVELTVVDRTNHHVFQPLLYQVATASLAPSDVAYPIRAVLSGRDALRRKHADDAHDWLAARWAP